MAGKELKFKLVLDADTKNYVQNTKQSEEVTKQVFDSIRAEADKLRQASQQTSDEIGKIIPTGTIELVGTLTEKLNAASDTISKSGAQAQQTAGYFREFGTTASKSIDQLKLDLVEAKANLERFSKTSASPTNILAAQAQVDQLEKEVNQAGQAFDRFEGEVNRANIGLNKTESASATASRGISGLRTGLGLLAGALAAVGFSVGIKELADTADGYTNLSARIQIATQEHGNFQQAMAGVHQVALATNTSLEATGTLFTKINDVGQQMGLTQQQSLDLTKTINQAIQTGGGSAQASEAAIQQFTQALQGGVLRGDEFNSIMEQAPSLTKALADGLGVGTKELRGMAEASELSADRVVRAIQSQSEKIQETYDKFPLTIGNALQKIGTQWQILIGDMNNANVASATVAQWLSKLADSMDMLRPLISDVGEGFAWIGDKLQSIDSSTVDALYQALKTAYDGLKSLISTIGDAFTGVVDILNTALSQVFSFASGIDSTEDSTNGFTKALQAINVALGFLSDGFTAIGIGVNALTGTFYTFAASFEQIKATFTWGDVREEALANMQAMQEKAQEYYQKASDGALNFKSKGVEALNEIGKTQAEKDQEAVASSKAKLDALLADQNTEKEGRKATEAEKLKAVQEYVDASMQANNGVLDGTVQADLLSKGYVVTLNDQGEASVKAWSKAEEGADKAEASANAAKTAAAALGIDLYELKNGITESFNNGSKALTDFSAGLQGLGIEGKQAADVTYEAWLKWLETAKSQNEIDVATFKLKEFGDQGKISTDMVQWGLEEIGRQAQKLPADIDPVTAAFERLGIKTKEQLALAAQSALADFNTIQQSGNATAWDLQKAYERTMQAAAASGDQAVISATQAKAASMGLVATVNDTGTATVQTYAEMNQAAQSHASTVSSTVTGAYRQMGQVAREEAKHSIDAWNEALTKKMEAEKAQSGGGAAAAMNDNINRNTSAVRQKLQNAGISGSELDRLTQEYKDTYAKRYVQLIKTGSYGAGKEIARLNDYYDRIAKNAENPSKMAVPASQSASKKVDYTINLGGKSVTLSGTEADQANMNDIMSQLETLKKGM